MDTFNEENQIILILVITMIRFLVTINSCVTQLFLIRKREKRKRPVPSRLKYSLTKRLPAQINHLYRIIIENDTACMNNTRLNRNAIAKLVYLLHTVSGLEHSKNVRMEEKVTILLSIVSHHKKNRIIGHDFIRSGEMVSKYFHEVLAAMLRLHPLLLAKPTPVDEECDDDRLKYFQGCLGALDGTYIKAKVRVEDKPRYRNRKKEIAINVLFVCDFNMRYIYVMTGWEGSAADSRVLKDAINKEEGLKVPVGNYYLADNGYANSNGFLTPYKRIRYHLREWGAGNLAPKNPQEFFNMKHSSARNVIEKSFSLLKSRWAIFSSHSYYPIKIQNQIIMACALLHNFCLVEMPNDHLHEIGEVFEEAAEHDQIEYIDIIGANDEWNTMRENLATKMYNERGHGRGRGRGRGSVPFHAPRRVDVQNRGRGRGRGH